MSKQQFVMFAIIVALGFSGLIIPTIKDKAELTDKPFVPGDYYRSYHSEGELDYKRIYSDVNGTEYQGAAACEVKDAPIVDGYPYKPKSELGFLWFWPLDAPDTNVVSSGTEVAGDYTLYEVQQGTELIAIADSTLVSKTQYPIGMYPTSGYSPGVHLAYIIKHPETKTAYKITYASMEKWWVCRDKTKPDALEDNKEYQPKFYMGNSFNDKKEFYSGTVVGYSGMTGVPQTSRAEGKSFLLVKVEKAELDEEYNITTDWKPIKVSDLYKGE